MFDIITSRDFLAKLEADWDDFVKKPHSARLALNCAITAFHLHEWVWGDWLKTDYATWRVLKIRDLVEFHAWINDACPWFETIRQLSVGTKHFGSAPSFKAERVGAPPFMFDELGAGWDEGAWDGPIPYEIESHGNGCLLIDYGEGSGQHRWRTVAALLYEVARFWQEFFALHHSDLSRSYQRAGMTVAVQPIRPAQPTALPPLGDAEREGPYLFDIVTSHDFLAKLEEDYDDFVKEPHSTRLALNCAITAFHLHEWVWGDWLEAHNALKDKDAFLAWIGNACPWFRTIQGLANGTKHFGSSLSFGTEFVVSPPYTYCEPAAEWDEGFPKPYVADGGKGHLLLDHGPGSGPHRWQTAASLIDVVVRFWREFFSRHHPNPDVRAKVRDYRLIA
jgi:hypothetical protein